MQFILIAYDAADSEAYQRRLRARPEHLEKVALLKRSGEFLLGGAILDENEKMIGSMIIYESPDKSALEESLKSEPYITQNVWEKIEIRPFRLAKIE
ncbi:MAG: hypothetical protein K0B05_09965 [Bacteroidales bacterium]|nr:hypothetical protein [Bacteroidales bacterium]